MRVTKCAVFEGQLCGVQDNAFAEEQSQFIYTWMGCMCVTECAPLNVSNFIALYWSIAHVILHSSL
jgi:hypothetical protein